MTVTAAIQNYQKIYAMHAPTTWGDKVGGGGGGKKMRKTILQINRQGERERKKVK